MLHDWQSRFASRLSAPPTGGAGDDHDFLGVQKHRFSIYQDNVIGSLTDALNETFPVTRQLVGDPFFTAVAVDFVRRELPRAPRLSRYGGAFPAMLRNLPQLQELAYVADVAALEWARVESYFAGVSETAVTPEALLAFSAERLPHLVFEAVSSLRVVTTATAAVSIWQAHQKTEPDLSSVDPWRKEAARVICTDLGISVTPLDPAHAAFLDTLRAGSDLSAAWSVAASVAADFGLQAALVDELQAGSFARARVLEVAR